MSQQATASINPTAIRAVNGVDVGVIAGVVGAITETPALGRCRFRAANVWQGGTRNRTTISTFYGAGQENAHPQPFVMHADEPPILAGTDTAPNPAEHLLNALAGCITTSLAAHAAVRGIAIEAMSCAVEGDLDLRGFLGMDDDVPRGFTDIRVRFAVKAAPEDMEELRRLTAFSPVLNTITGGTRVDIAVAAG